MRTLGDIDLHVYALAVSPKVRCLRHTYVLRCVLRSLRELFLVTCFYFSISQSIRAVSK